LVTLTAIAASLSQFHEPHVGPLHGLLWPAVGQHAILTALLAQLLTKGSFVSTANAITLTVPEP